MARKEGFEPSRRFPTYSLSREPLHHLVLPHFIIQRRNSCKCSAPCIIRWRRGWDSNPRFLSESLVFKTSSLNRSDTSPLDCIKQLYYYTIKSRFCQEKTANFFGQFQKVLFSMEKEKNPGKS